MEEKSYTLRYNSDSDRFGVWDGSDWRRDGLHCGECIEVLIHGIWTSTRIEFGQQGWYLVDLGGISMNGLPVRL